MAADDAALPAAFPRSEEDSLILLEINLCRYADAALSEKALQGIDALFRALRKTGCGLIVRFLYDWAGRNPVTEPRKLETILCHISQIGPLLRENADRIFLTQGLFVGSWGEMHSSRFLRREDLQRLYTAYSRAVGEQVRLSLRTPALWRSLTGLTAPPASPGISLPGLFNDGMLASESDFGTYADEPSARETELAFQEKLCLFVPNGGEVIGAGALSDPESAVRALKRMRVSYLNRDYDERALAKWKNAVIRDQSIWNGMSFFDYIQTHLGYRFVVRRVRLRCFAGMCRAEVAVENVGFAPLYHAAEARLVFVRDRREAASFPLKESAPSETEPRVFTARLGGLKDRLGPGSYDMYFRLVSLKYGGTIRTANQGSSAWGCPIGRYVGT